MSIEVSEYINVLDKLKKLGVEPSNSLLLLPWNFATEEDELEGFYYPPSTSDIREVFDDAELAVKFVGEGGEPNIIHLKSFTPTLVLPTLYIGLFLLSQNPYAITVALNLISHYAAKALDAAIGGLPYNEVELEIIVDETGTGTTQRITYRGSDEGLTKLSDIIRSTRNKDG
jgi:hypothetical protein